MPTDPLTASRYPAASNVPNVPQDIQNAVFDLADNTIPYFTSTAARDTAYTAWTAAGGVMREGLYCHVAGQGMHIYFAGAWSVVWQKALLHGSGTQNVTSQSVNFAAVVLDTQVFASGLTTTTASGRINATRAGVLLCSGGVSFSANVNGRRYSGLMKNGTLIPQSQNRSDPDAANSGVVATATYPIQVASGDYIQVAGLQDSGSTLTFQRDSCFLQAHWIGW